MEFEEEDLVGAKGGPGGPDGTYVVELKELLTLRPEPGPLEQKQGKRRDRETNPRSYNLQSGSQKAQKCPLVDKGQGKGIVYHAFSFTDTNCILKKMPNPTEGGGLRS